MATSLMDDVLGNTPCHGQKDVISHMVKLLIPYSGINCAPSILLVQPTAGGKSSLDVASFLFEMFSP